MRRLLLLSFFLICCCRLVAQPEPEQLEERLKASREDTGRISLLLEIAQHYLVKPGESKTDLDRTLHHSRYALELSRKLNQPRWEGLSLLMAGNGHVELSELPKVIS